MALDKTDVLGSIFTGWWEADKADTAQRLKTRGEELRNKQAIVKQMKTADYNKDIAKYDADKKVIDGLNSVAANKSMYKDDLQLGQAVLIAKYGDKFDSFKKSLTSPDGDLTQFYNFAKTEGQNFNTSGTEGTQISKNFKDKSVIDAEYTAALDEIEKDTKEAIDAAAGDSKTINAIMKLKNRLVNNISTDTKNVQTIDSVNETVKATGTSETETLKKIEEDIKPEKEAEEVSTLKSADIPLFINKDTTAYKNFNTNNTKYASDLRKSNANKSSADNQLTIAQTFKQMGIKNVGDYFKTNNEGGITAFKKGGENFADTMHSQYKMYKDYKIQPGTDNLYLALNKDSVNLISYYDKENANGFLANRTKELAVPVAKGNIAGEGGAFNFSNILRSKENLIVVPTANTIDFDGTIIGSDIKLTSTKDKVRAKQLYAQALINNSKVDGQINIALLKKNQDTLQNLEYNKSNALLEKVNNDFISLYKGTTPAADDGTPPPNKDVGTIKITNPADGTFQIKKDTIANRNLAAQKAKELNVDISEILSEIKNIKQEPTAGDASVAETTMGVNNNIFGNKIKPESELGDVNPKFTTLESVLKILPNNMTGQEIQEKYNIDFKINPKSIYRPLK
jgi:hypothetical protein